MADKIGKNGSSKRVPHLFKKGNKLGGRRPDALRLPAWIRDLGGVIPNDSEDGATYAQSAAIALYEQARSGNVNAARLIFDRIEPAITVTADITERLTRDEQIEQIAQNARGFFDRWSGETNGSASCNGHA